MRAICLLALLLPASIAEAQMQSTAQGQSAPGIRGVTRRSVTSPGIGVDALVPLTNATLSLSQPFAAPPPRVVVRVTRKDDPAELDKRILAFQKKCAEGGSPSAQFDLAKRYWHGQGVPKDPKLAQYWLERASENGNAAAAKVLEIIRNSDSSAPSDRPDPKR